jgi:hypothetical protein
MFVMVTAQTFVAGFLQTFQEFPTRQNPASFTIDQVLEKLASPTNFLSLQRAGRERLGVRLRPTRAWYA